SGSMGPSGYRAAGLRTPGLVLTRPSAMMYLRLKDRSFISALPTDKTDSADCSLAFSTDARILSDNQSVYSTPFTTSVETSSDRRCSLSSRISPSYAGEVWECVPAIKTCENGIPSSAAIFNLVLEDTTRLIHSKSHSTMAIS